MRARTTSRARVRRLNCNRACAPRWRDAAARVFKPTVLQAASIGDGERTTAATLALDDRRHQNLQRLHGEIAASERQLTDSDVDPARSNGTKVHQSELRRRRCSIRLRETLHVSEGDRQVNVEKKFDAVCAAIDSMQVGLCEVRSELSAIQQQLQRRHGAAVRGRRVSSPSRRRGKKRFGVFF
jgi:hypothetical protein